jgi:hypothetical protein
MCDLLLANSLAETGVQRYAAPPTDREEEELPTRGRSSSPGRCGSLNLIVTQATVIEPCIQA